MRNEPAMILGTDVLGTVASLNIDFQNQIVLCGKRETCRPRVLLGQ
jgi:hypothetical protein